MAFYEKAVRVVSEYEGLMETAPPGKAIYKGQVFFGFPPVAGTCYFCDLIAKFAKEYPGIKLHIEERGANRILAGVEAGTLDVGCVVGPVQTQNFDYVPFIRDTSCLAVSENHPLADRKIVSLAELKDESFVLLGRDFATHHDIISACHQAGFEPNIVLLSSQWDFLVEVAAQNRAITILPKPIYDKYPVTAVRWVPLSDGPRVWDVRVARNKKRYMSNACKAFLRHIEDRRPPDDLL